MQDKNLVGQYTIKNGVKQGDALSCMLFNLVMETLLRKINGLGMDKLYSNKLNFKWPNAIGYADDITLLLVNEGDLQICMEIYEDFYKATGLLLNATKTEIMALNIIRTSYNFRYLGKFETTNSKDMLKINGIKFTKNPSESYNINWESVRIKLTDQLIRWTRRNLTILGKILIVKTYGISQALYLARVMPPKPDTINQLEKIMDKFIWTHNMLGNKAPNRIRRRIMRNATARGGFGQADLDNIVKTMNTRQIIINEWNDSLAAVLNNKMTEVGSIKPVAHKLSDQVIKNYVDTTNKLWDHVLDNKLNTVEANEALLNTKLANVLNTKYNKGIWHHVLKAGKRKLRDIPPHEREEIRQKLKTEYSHLTLWTQSHQEPRKTYPTNDGNTINYPPKATLVDITCINPDIETCPKAGMLMTINESYAFYRKVKRIKSIWARTTILRFTHADMPYNEKLFRTKYVDSARCNKCWEIDTFSHKYLECNDAKRTWKGFEDVTGQRISEVDDIIKLDQKSLTYFAFVVNRLRKENLNPEGIASEVATYVDARTN